LPSLPGAIGAKNEAECKQKWLFLINDTFSKIMTFVTGPPPGIKGKILTLSPERTVLSLS
jgi:hypothetical protein